MPAIPDPFAPSAPSQLPVTEAASRLVATYQSAAQNYYRAYLSIQNQLYKSPYGYSEEQMVAALGPDFYAQLQRDAVLTKSVINFATPGKIADSVPVATITF